jgi:hypothetical protein
MEPALRAHVAFEFARFRARHEIAPTEGAKGVCTMRLLQTLRAAVNGEQDVEGFAEATAGLGDAGFLGHRVAVSKEAIKVTLKLGDKDQFQYFETVYRINGLVEQPFILGDEGLERNVPASKVIFFSYSLETSPYKWGSAWEHDVILREKWGDAEAAWILHNILGNPNEGSVNGLSRYCFLDTPFCG